MIALSFPLAAYVRAELRPLLRTELPPYASLRMANVRVAPLATLAWLDEHAGEYDVYAVRFKARFARFHVYAIRAHWPHASDVLEALALSPAPDPHASHLALLR